MIKMKATKNMRYGTRRLMAGDIFEVNKPSDVRVLKAIRKAEEYKEELPPIPATLKTAAMSVGTVQTDAIDQELKIARADYEDATGKRAFFRWTTAELREKIKEHNDKS